MDYRKATINDIDLLVTVRMDFLSESTSMTREERIALLRNNTEYLIKSFSEDSFAAWLAVMDNQVIATSGITFYSLPPNKVSPNGKIGYISNMFTYPNYRRQGIASNLFRLTVDEARQRDCGKIILTATAMGRSLYEKYGFVNQGNEMKYIIKYESNPKC